MTTSPFIASPTPGPWAIEPDNAGRFMIEAHASTTTPLVLAVTEFSPRISVGEAVANARLMAAAPAQHSALIEAAAAMEDAVREALSYVPEGSVVPEWITRLNNAAGRARGVIATSVVQKVPA